MSSFMDWVLDVASSHPDLEGAFVSADGDWLDVLLADGRTFRFRPGEMIDETKPEDIRRKLLDRLISIGVTQAHEAVIENHDEPPNGMGSASSTDGSGPATPRTSTSKISHPDSADSKPSQAASRSPFGSVFDAIMGALPGATAAADKATGFPMAPSDDAVNNSVDYDGPTRTLPIVRPADYFLASHDHSRRFHGLRTTHRFHRRGIGR